MIRIKNIGKTISVWERTPLCAACFDGGVRATDGVTVMQGLHADASATKDVKKKKKKKDILGRCGKHAPEGRPDLEWLSQTIAHLWGLYPDKRRYRHS